MSLNGFLTTISSSYSQISLWSAPDETSTKVSAALGTIVTNVQEYDTTWYSCIYNLETRYVKKTFLQTYDPEVYIKATVKRQTELLSRRSSKATIVGVLYEGQEIRVHSLTGYPSNSDDTNRYSYRVVTVGSGSYVQAGYLSIIYITMPEYIVNAPTNLTASPSRGPALTLSWRKGSSNVVGDTISYQIVLNDSTTYDVQGTSYVFSEDVTSTWTSAQNIYVKSYSNFLKKYSENSNSVSYEYAYNWNSNLKVNNKTNAQGKSATFTWDAPISEVFSEFEYRLLSVDSSIDSSNIQATTYVLSEEQCKPFTEKMGFQIFACLPNGEYQLGDTVYFTYGEEIHNNSTVKYYNGTQWVPCEIKTFTNNEWKLCNIYKKDSTGWKQCSS